LRKYKNIDLIEVFNMSINNTLSRTVMTSITTLLALISLYLFGGAVIKPFALTMIIGVLVGTYSSIFIAVPTLLVFKFRPQDEDD
jgi:preprotein translocase SecF subunit